MAIGQDKIRIIVTITKEMKEQLIERAEKENRTVSNLINTILLKELNNK